MTFMDYDIQRCTRRCAVTDRELQPGEDVYSVVVWEGGQWVRRDYSAEAWSGPPQEAVAWWKSRIALPTQRRRSWAPGEVMLQLFEELENQPGQEDFRYVLALLMVRRNLLRQEDTAVASAAGNVTNAAPSNWQATDPPGPADVVERAARQQPDRPWITVYSPHTDKQYRVAVVLPSSQQRAREIQEQLCRLLQ
jgi:hypothetical protein